MMLLYALLLIGFGAAALLAGLATRRPALILLSGTILASHAWPLIELSRSRAGISATLQAQDMTVATIALIASLAWLSGYNLFARSRPMEAAYDALLAPPVGLHHMVLAILGILLLSAPGGIFGFAHTGFLRLPVDSFLFSLTYATACLAALTTTVLCVFAATGRAKPPLVSIGFVLLVFWLLGGRTQLAISAMSFALVFLAHRRVRIMALALPGLMLMALATLTLSFRLALQGETIGLIDTLRLMAAQVSLLEGYALCARFVEEFGTRTALYADTLLQIVPRAVFPEKPLQLSRALRLMEARDTLGGLTPGLAGEAFVVGGMIGVAAIGLAFGGALAALDNGYRRLVALRPLTQALVVSLLPLLAIFTLRGGFDTSIFRLDILLVAGLSGLFIRAPLPMRRPAI